jgi:hypothetical protein
MKVKELIEYLRSAADLDTEMVPGMTYRQVIEELSKRDPDAEVSVRDGDRVYTIERGTTH